MAKKRPRKNREDLKELKRQFLKEHEKASKKELSLSEDGFLRMNGPIGMEITESQWEMIKTEDAAKELKKKK